MTGPIASISLSASLPTALPGTAVLPSLLAVGAPAATPGAVPTLAAFVDLMVAQPQVAATPRQPAGDRQDDAAPGNALPDGDDDTMDPALAWLMGAPVLPTPVPSAPVVPQSGAAVAISAQIRPDFTAQAAPASDTATDVQPIESRADPAPAGVPPSDVIARDVPRGAAPVVVPIAMPVASGPAVSAPLATITLPAPVAASDDPPPPPAVPSAETPVRATVERSTPVAQPRAPIAVAAAALHIPQAQPVTLARILTASAAQPALFALAAERDRGDDGEARPLSAATTAATLLQPADAAALIAKPGEAQRQALDMGQPDWPQKMIDRIEVLRDNANATDTSIRLKPDALGRVDVSLKTQADGAVAVRFAAEQPATRALLADAAPQLTAAAEARGIRLSQTSVDLAGSGQGQRQSQGFERPQNISNRLAPSEAQEAVSDGRVA